MQMFVLNLFSKISMVDTHRILDIAFCQILSLLINEILSSANLVQRAYREGFRCVLRELLLVVVAMSSKLLLSKGVRDRIRIRNMFDETWFCGTA